MTSIEKIRENYEIGNEIFQILFKLNDEELKTKLLSILDNDKLDILNHNPDVIRTIRNEDPFSISIAFYDTLIIDWSGIDFKPEHGPAYPLIKFNKHFKL